LVSGGLILGTGKLNAFGNVWQPSALPPIEYPDYWKFVREQFVFPKDFIYLNTGGIGAVPTRVMNKVEITMYEGELSPKPGHNLDKWNEIKEYSTDLLSPLCTKEELALVSCATEGINIIVNGLPLKEGDEVIVSTHEHPAVHIPLLNLKQRKGIVLKVFDPDLEKGSGNVDKIKELISPKTKLIFISHVTCTTGQIYPLKEISDLARENNVWFAVDGAQAVGAMPMDIVDLGIDFYTYSGHKWTLGPKRTGVLYVKKDLLELVQPITVGAYSDDGYDIYTQELKLQSTAQRYEYGTENESIFYGMQTGMELIKAIEVDRVWDHNRTLAEYFYSGMQKIPGIELVSPVEKKYRSQMISFKVPGMNYRDVGDHLYKQKIRVRVVPEAGLEAIRVSFHIYNQESDVRRILEELDAFVAD